MGRGQRAAGASVAHVSDGDGRGQTDGGGLEWTGAGLHGLGRTGRQDLDGLGQTWADGRVQAYTDLHGLGRA